MSPRRLAVLTVLGACLLAVLMAGTASARVKLWPSLWLMEWPSESVLMSHAPVSGELRLTIPSPGADGSLRELELVTCTERLEGTVLTNGRESDRIGLTEAGLPECEADTEYVSMGGKTARFELSHVPPATLNAPRLVALKGRCAYELPRTIRLRWLPPQEAERETNFESGAQTGILPKRLRRADEGHCPTAESNFSVSAVVYGADSIPLRAE